MPSRSDITYFGAGPSSLPTVVIENAAGALVNFNDTGLGIAEHSHRSAIASAFYSVYVAGQVLKKLLLQHPDKVLGQQALSEKKAQLIYKAVDAHPDFYKVIPDKTVRSRMNICFRIEGGDTAEQAFPKEGTAQGLTGLKGHRSVGGIRASNLLRSLPNLSMILHRNKVNP
ncbi:hypothetical protein O1611_g5418 [Lasiodiplodia mahajangana]|uniref:Uncharacterized protein n=1 Tax=Lasiodiplodia mahajangana TaxID=1108764 RepID=A0ACC2JLZ1_9PEZI|nr:hypothetical protein O1611_g5418 [Lasiodiplodia mahajangana]